MNHGLIGLPVRPTQRPRVQQIDALGGSIGTPIMRTTGNAGAYESGGSPTQLAAIKATAGLWAIAYSPIDDCMYACANTADGQVVVASPAALRVARRFHVGANPLSMAYAPTTRRLLILRADGTLVVYSPRRRIVERIVATGVLGATAVVFVPSDGKAYVVGSASAGAKIDLLTFAVTAFAIPGGAQDAVFHLRNNTLVLACTAGMGAYDIRTQSSLGIVSASTVPMHHVGFSPASSYALATNRTVASKYVYHNAVTNVGGEQIFTPGSALGAVGYSPRSRVLCVSDDASGVRAYDVGVSGYVSWGSAVSCGLPRAIAHCPTDGRMYAVSDAGAPEIAVVS